MISEAVAAGREVETLEVPSKAQLRVVVAAGVLVVAIGLFLRLWAVGRQPVNADQAVVALMARGILRGHFYAFYWGQNYGGGEPYVVAVLFAMLGRSFYVLGLAPVLLDVVAAWLVYLLGRRLFSRSVGICAALLFWVWPEATLWQSTLEYGFRIATLDCGLAASVIGLRMLAVGQDASMAPARASAAIRRDAALLGVVLGVGWWCSPEIVYFAAPLFVVMMAALLHRRLQIGGVEIGRFLLLFALGALPWLWSNLRSNFASFRSSPQPHPGFFAHFQVFLTHSFPIAVGAQLTATGRWLGGPTVGPALAALVAAIVIGFLALCVRERRAGFVVLFCGFFPVVYAYSPFTWYWADARYVVYLPPLLAIAVAGGVEALGIRIRFRSLGQWKRALLPAAAAVALALSSTLAAAALRAPFRPDHITHSAQQSWGTFSFAPNSFETQISVDLRRLGLDHVIIGYWLAYPIDFLSHEQIVGSDIVFVRNAQILQQVLAAKRPAWVFANPSDPAFRDLVATTHTGLLDPGCAVGQSHCLTAARFETMLRVARMGFKTIMLTGDGLQVIVPIRQIPIADVLRRLNA